MAKTVLIAGLERGDFTYYLSTILAMKGNVLVADNSYAGDLFTSLCHSTEDNLFEWKNITFVRNLDVNGSNTEGYEYILIYAGLDLEGRYSSYKDIVVLAMPDYTKQCLDTLREHLPVEENTVLYILRDMCSKKITNKAAATYLNVSPKAIAGALPLSEKDISSYISFTHNKRQSFKSVSADMETALEYVATVIFETELKKISRLIAKAKKMK